MLVEMYIFYSVLALLVFATGFYSKQPILWVIAMVLFAFITVSSFHIEDTEYVYDSSTLSYTAQHTSYSYAYLSTINIMFFILAMIMFVYDMFIQWKDVGADPVLPKGADPKWGLK